MTSKFAWLLAVLPAALVALARRYSWPGLMPPDRSPERLRSVARRVGGSAVVMAVERDGDLAPVASPVLLPLMVNGWPFSWRSGRYRR